MKLERHEVADKAQQFIEELFEKAQLDLQTEIETRNDNGILIDIRGEDSEVVLADNARLLYSVNHLVNQIFYRQSKEGCNFFLDCNNYRSDRCSELELLARKAAEKVRLSGMGISLQPMPSSERRIIHLALANESDIRTESQGTGRYRRVLIVPSVA